MKLTVLRIVLTALFALLFFDAFKWADTWQQSLVLGFIAEYILEPIFVVYILKKPL